MALSGITKPIVVPQWNNQNVVLYTPSTVVPSTPSITNGVTTSVATGAAVPNPNFTVDQTVLGPLFQNANTYPNACMVSGTDLFVTVSGHAQGVVKLPGYLSDPATAKSNAFVIDLTLNDYAGLAMDLSGNLYVAAGNAPDNNIVRYPGAGFASGGTINGISLGNAGMPSYFCNLVFDLSGNLWATDYWNNRVVVFAASSLTGQQPAVWLALENPANSSSMLNTWNVPSSGFPAQVPYLFTSPEGLDFDSFVAYTGEPYATGANLWVANNNDGQNHPRLQNANTTLVQLTYGMLAKLLHQLQTAPNTTVTADQFVDNHDFYIFQVPNYPKAGGSSSVPQFGGLQIDKAAGMLYVNDQSGDSGSGWVRCYPVNNCLPFFQNDPTDQSSRVIANDTSGIGGIALLGLGPYVGDNANDTESPFEPDLSESYPPAPPEVLYESPNIVATIENTAGLTVLPAPYADAAMGIGADGSDTVLGGLQRYIYVQVNNFAPTPTTGLEQLNLYWSKATVTGPGLVFWPQPWDGNAPPDPLFNEPMGGIVALGIAIPPIAGFGNVIVGPVPWTTPDPTKYSSQDGHFSLLARIVTPNAHYAENTAPLVTTPQDTSLLAFAGMSFPEVDSTWFNVQQNARIAWRNVHIIATEPPGGGAVRFPPAGVVAWNLSAAPVRLRIAFELLDAERKARLTRVGPLSISAAGKSLDVLKHSTLGSRPREGRYELNNPAAGIQGLFLAPGETLTFHVEYAPPESHSYSLRATAFVQEGGRDRPIGGQTFVYQHIEGFGAAKERG